MKVYAIIKDYKTLLIYNKSIIYITDLCKKLQRLNPNHIYEVEIRYINNY